MKKLLVVQGIIPKYRVPLFQDISSILGGNNVSVLADVAGHEFGVESNSELKFHTLKANWKRFFIFFISLGFWKKSRQYQTILHVADFKYSTLWVSLLLGLFNRKKIYLHGQGGYKRRGVRAKLVYFFAIAMSDGYICYCDYSLKELRKKIPKFMHQKLHVCENTLYFPILKKRSRNTENALLFIGRLRERSDIEALLDVAKLENIVVHVIGTGDVAYINRLQNIYPENIFHGAIFDFEKQREVAERCFAGVYSGDAGLSVVNYMALGLPLIVHCNLQEHMGPEPSYVRHEENGLVFHKGDKRDLLKQIKRLESDRELQAYLAGNALSTFKKLSSPSMGRKMVEILGLIT